MNAGIDLEDYLDAEVMDDTGKLIGSLRCFWADDKENAIFLGVKAAWQSDQTVVVPITLAQANEYHSCVLLKVSEERLRGAPTLSCEESLSVDLEDRTYAWFEMPPPRNRSRLQINKAATNQIHSKSG